MKKKAETECTHKWKKITPYLVPLNYPKSFEVSWIVAECKKCGLFKTYSLFGKDKGSRAEA